LTFTNNEEAERGSGINESEWEKKQDAISEDQELESFEEEVEESMEEEMEESEESEETPSPPLSR